MRRKSITSEMMKSYIADSLLLLMENKNFQDITIEEIVKKAGVNRSTYYRHFNKKEDVILYFLDNISRDIAEYEKVAFFSLEAHLTNIYAHYFEHKRQMLTIYRNGLSFLFFDTLKKYLEKAMHSSKQVPLQYNIAFHIGGTFNHFMLWFSRNMIDSPETMAKYMLDILSENYIHHIWGEQTKE